MKTAFVNLPYPIPIVRRYRCSYNAPTFLLPPIELMYLEAVARKWNNQKTIVIDAVAEGLNGDQVLDKLKSFGPDLIATITGVESVNTDMAEIRRLKLAMPDVRIVMMGHLVTVFPEEYLNDGIADYIIASEPEETFSELCKKLDSGNSTEKMPGLFSFPEGRLSVGPPRLRMENIDSLPFPDRTLIDNSRYGEPFCKKPFTTMLSSRGCPFNCVYCISTYGDKMSFRSPENILEEIKIIAGSGIRALRFLDDTFNVRTKRVAEICELIISSGIRLEWTCLSRPDTIDPEVLPLMRRAGCIRLYMGIESGSQKMLDLYRRGYDRELAIEKVRAVRKQGMQVTGFFIVGGPEETEEDFRMTLDLSRRTKCDFYIADRLRPYPGTALFDLYRDKIDFSARPYKNEYTDPAVEVISAKRERVLYNSLYLDASFIPLTIKLFMRYPRETISNMLGFVKFLFSRPGKNEHDKYL